MGRCILPPRWHTTTDTATNTNTSTNYEKYKCGPEDRRAVASCPQDACPKPHQSLSAICNSIIICTIASKNNTLDQSLHFLYLCYLLFSPPESDESYARHDFCCEVQVFSAKQLSITFSSVEFFWWASGLGLFWPKRLLADPCKD